MNEDNRVWEQLGPGCARRRLPGLDVTVGLVVGTAALVVIDTGATLAEGARLLEEVRELTGRQPTDVVLTHGHFDHVLGTPAFPGARVHGAAGLADHLTACRAELREDAVRHGVDPAEAAEAVDALVVPDHEVGAVCEIGLGGDRAALLVPAGPGHTAHDLAVVVPGTPAVVFCGDLVEESGEPQAGPDAVPAGWPAALDRLVERGGETAVYVPGHGAVVDARFVRTQRDTLAERFGTP